MKKLVSLVLILALVFAVSACAPKTNEPKKTIPSDTSTTTSTQGTEPEASTTTPSDTNTTEPSEQTTEPEASANEKPADGKTLGLDTAVLTLTNAMELTKNLLDEPMVRVADVFRASFSVTDEDYEEAVSSWEDSVKENNEFAKRELTVDGQPATVFAYLTETGTDVQVYVKQTDGKALNILVLGDNPTAKPVKPADMIANEHFMALLEGIKIK